MRLYCVRHGETDWNLVEARGAKGWAKDFAPLTALGRLQIDTIARDYRLQEAEAILCSTYTRALESAALLSRAINKPLYVEHDLHEWLPQKDPFGEIDPGSFERARQSLSGTRIEEDAPWESLDEVRSRVIAVLRRYRRFETLVVVTHGVVIGSLVGVQRLVDHAEIVPFDLDLDSPIQVGAGPHRVAR
ncbi:MAG: histidine phosphatase family protein [Trueperaceae bacterium]|nr:histidine phosphatase family protein [Trueperaceae bacterium]MCC6309564.1 histidine phosphatase family protein [Trueperaceae bacterium]